MRLAVEADGAPFRLDDVNEVVVVAGLDFKLAAFRDRSMMDVQILRTAQSLAADRSFKSGRARLGFGLLPVDD